MLTQALHHFPRLLSLFINLFILIYLLLQLLRFETIQYLRFDLSYRNQKKQILIQLRHLIFVYLSFLLPHYSHPNQIFNLNLTPPNYFFYLLLFFLLFVLFNCRLVIIHLIVDFLYQHQLLLNLQLIQLHFSYLVLFTFSPHPPSTHRLIEIYLIRPIILLIILNTFDLRNLLTFRCHFIIFCLHYHSNFSIHLCDPLFALKTLFHLQYFLLLNGLQPIQYPFHPLFLNFHFFHLINVPLLHIIHFFGD